MKKHNKKRNTAFLYEILITEASKALVNKRDDHRKKVVTLIKESFNKNTELGKELFLYKKLLNENQVPARLAISFVSEVNNLHKKINRKKLFNEQTTLIRTINRSFDSKVFDNFVDNYRMLGSIYQLFNTSDDKIEDRVQLQESVAAQIVSAAKKEENKLDPIDKITYNIYVKKFNEKYSNYLNESQKNLIKNYIYSVKDNGVSFKIYISDEIENLKENISKAIKSDEYADEQIIQEKLQSVLEKIDTFKNSPLNQEMITDIMLMQQLSEELRKNDSN